MAQLNIQDESTLRISVGLEDAMHMVAEAAEDVRTYAKDIITIYEKMPFFDYTSFCFYAYDSAMLFEEMLGINPKAYNSFTLDAPDAFFFTLYGGMGALYETAKAAVEAPVHL